MSKLNIIKPEKMEKLLLKLEFKRIRQKGSHVFYRHPDGRTTTIPFHTNRILSRPLLREILNEIELNVDKYNLYLKEL